MNNEKDYDLNLNSNNDPLEFKSNFELEEALIEYLKQI